MFVIVFFPCTSSVYGIVGLLISFVRCMAVSSIFVGAEASSLSVGYRGYSRPTANQGDAVSGSHSGLVCVAGVRACSHLVPAVPGSSHDV
jgi:hypothetical protein